MTLSRSTVLRTTLRERKCVVCAQRFKQQRAMQKVCSPACGQDYSRREREKQDRKETRERKVALKTKGDWLREAQAVFNQWIRARDQMAGNPCICCGAPLDWSGNNVDAGHYLSRGSAPHLRFEENNVHAQTKMCNRYKSGNAVYYRVGLISRIGAEAVNALESDHTPRHWTIADLKQIITTYRAKLAELKRNAS